MFKGLKAKNLGIAEENVISWFHAYASGEEVKGWPALRISFDYKGAMVYLTKDEIVIASGWLLDAVLRIPRADVVSVSVSGYKMPGSPISLPGPDVYRLRYKKQKTEKEIEFMPRIGTLTKNLEAAKGYFQPFLK